MKNLENEKLKTGNLSAPNNGGIEKIQPKLILSVSLTGYKNLRVNEWPGSEEKGGSYQTIELSERVPVEKIIKDADKAEQIASGYGYVRVRLSLDDLPILAKGIERILGAEGTK